MMVRPSGKVKLVGSDRLVGSVGLVELDVSDGSVKLNRLVSQKGQTDQSSQMS